MKIVFTLLVAVLAYQVAKIVTGVTIGDFARLVVSSCFGFVGRRVDHFAATNASRFATMNSAQRKKSRRYWYYMLMNEIMLDMDWKQKGMTVEGMTGSLVIIACLIGILYGLLTKSPLGTIMIPFLAFVTEAALLFMISRENHRERKKCIIHAEDGICQSIQLGLVRAVEVNLKHIDESIRYNFSRFVDDVKVLNISLEEALYSLNMNIGRKLTTFCEEALHYEQERREGMEKVFDGIVADNGFETRQDIKAERKFSEMNWDYLMSVGLIFLFILFTYAKDQFMYVFWTSTAGTVLLTGIAVISLVVFIFLQYLQTTGTDNY